jgi:hypothetical protein
MSPVRGDRQTFKNEDLVLKVSQNIDPAVRDEAKPVKTVQMDVFAYSRVPLGQIKPRREEAERRGFVDHLEPVDLLPVLIQIDHAVGHDVHVAVGIDPPGNRQPH